MVKKRTPAVAGGSGDVSDAELQRRIDEFAAAADGGQPTSTPVESGNEKKMKTVFFTVRDAELIKRAAEADGRTQASFMRVAVLRAALAVLEEKT